MSFKSSAAKLAIKLTPNKLVIWIANIILKDIAALKAFTFDLEPRKAYVQILLEGEPETIDVWLEDFIIINNEGSYKLFIQQAKSNRLWLDNILSRIVRKEWKIPIPSQMASQFEFVAEVFKAEKPAQEENE